MNKTPLVELSSILAVTLHASQPKSVLIAGDLVARIYKQQNTTKQTIHPPFTLDKLTKIAVAELAIVSDLTETVSKPQAAIWLGTLRNAYAQKIMLIADLNKAAEKGWQFTDYLALSMKHIASYEHYHFFSYAITTYQIKKDWLNSKFWANPENFDKYRW